MNANIMLNEDITPIGSDYDTVRGVIELLTLDYREQPSLEAIAARLGQSPTQLQKTFTRWAGLSPKAFLQAVTLDHAKRLLREEDLPLLETSIEVGMSGPGRLHDLFVTHEAMSPGEWKAKGGGLTIRYGFHASPFGLALVMITDRGLAGCAFADPGDERACFEDMAGRWPNADYVEDREATAPYAARIFEPAMWTADKPLRVVLLGTDFQVRVWKFLPNLEEAEAITGRSEPEAAIRTLAEAFPIVALKGGAEGAWVSSAAGLHHRAAQKVPVIDTTGAGDAFNAGFLDAWLQRQDEQQCLKAGIAAGSLAVQAAGGAPRVTAAA